MSTATATLSFTISISISRAAPHSVFFSLFLGAYAFFWGFGLCFLWLFQLVNYQSVRFAVPTDLVSNAILSFYSIIFKSFRGILGEREIAKYGTYSLNVWIEALCCKSLIILWNVLNILFYHTKCTLVQPETDKALL